MKLDIKQNKHSLTDIPEKIAYFALTLAILKEYSASQALRYIKKGE